MKGDDNQFGSLHARLKQNIYDTVKGKLRLDLIAEDVDNIILPMLTPGDHLIDIGCGEARIIERFIQRDYKITLLDPSGEVLDLVKKRLLESNLDLTGVCWCCGPLQKEIPLIEGDFGLIIMHAVIEWLHDPWQALDMVAKRIARHGVISLAYYNRNCLIYRNLLQGNFRKICRDDWQQSSTGLTPLNPIDPLMVNRFFQGRGFKLLRRRGIRCFYDFMREPVKQQRTYQDIFDMERKYSLQEPFMSLGRYQHEIWQR